jgi:hypothetical protein
MLSPVLVTVGPCLVSDSAEWLGCPRSACAYVARLVWPGQIPRELGRRSTALSARAAGGWSIVWLVACLSAVAAVFSPRMWLSPLASFLGSPLGCLCGPQAILNVCASYMEILSLVAAADASIAASRRVCMMRLWCRRVRLITIAVL